jgi:hypothetical protein
MMENQVCCKCGILFSMPAHYIDSRRKDKETFYCPNGHRLVFGGPSLDSVEKELISVKANLAEEVRLRKLAELKIKQRKKK